MLFLQIILTSQSFQNNLFSLLLMKVTDDKIVRIYDLNDLSTLDIVVVREMTIFEIVNNSW